MARDDFQPRRTGADGAATNWILGLLALGVVLALLVVAFSPDPATETTSPGTTSDQVIPNTPPPVRSE
jgi:hypothetical protein